MRAGSKANRAKVIPFPKDICPEPDQPDAAELAYEHWLGRFGLRYGPPEDDLFRALIELMERRSSADAARTKLFLVRKPQGRRNHDRM